MSFKKCYISANVRKTNYILFFDRVFHTIRPFSEREIEIKFFKYHFGDFSIEIRAKRCRDCEYLENRIVLSVAIFFFNVSLTIGFLNRIGKLKLHFFKNV